MKDGGLASGALFWRLSLGLKRTKELQVLGLWIDSLDDVGRDAIISHRDPSYMGSAWWSSHRDCGCLVGCVVDALGLNYLGRLEPYGRGIPITITIPARSAVVGWTDAEALRAFYAGCRFPKLVKRFGPERMWSLVKARAARGRGPGLPVAELAMAECC